jgi:hypothetical protein
MTIVSEPVVPLFGLGGVVFTRKVLRCTSKLAKNFEKNNKKY